MRDWQRRRKNRVSPGARRPSGALSFVNAFFQDFAPMSLSVRIALLSFVAAAACGAPATVATSPAPAPSNASAPALPVATGQPTRVPAVHVAALPRNWQLLDESADGMPGISSERAMHELLAGRAPRRTVLVAIIDNGIDTAHVDLRGNLWTDPQTQTHGWDFIGGPDGRDVGFDTF